LFSSAAPCRTEGHDKASAPPAPSTWPHPSAAPPPLPPPRPSPAGHGTHPQMKQRELPRQHHNRQRTRSTHGEWTQFLRCHTALAQGTPVRLGGGAAGPGLAVAGESRSEWRESNRREGGRRKAVVFTGKGGGIVVALGSAQCRARVDNALTVLCSFFCKRYDAIILL